MALARTRRRNGNVDFWPGFVDAMATLLLVIIFLLSIFMLTQFFLSQEISGKDTILTRLNAQIAELSELLSLERSDKRSLEENLAALTDSLATSEGQRADLQSQLSEALGGNQSADERTAALAAALDQEQEVSVSALARVELLNQQVAALRRQLDSLERALDLSTERDAESQAKIADLGRRLNAALARRVQELESYRSDFFGRLRNILSQRSDIEVVGDRFVFQSEVLFGSGSEQINSDGTAELDKLADALIDLEQKIPSEINWVIRVDGHTDNRPINSERFPSNWDLSATRAISVVRYLVSKGVSPNRLVAAGFGEFQPIDAGDSPEALRKNRRIELKLTER